MISTFALLSAMFKVFRFRQSRTELPCPQFRRACNEIRYSPRANPQRGTPTPSSYRKYTAAPSALRRVNDVAWTANAAITGIKTNTTELTVEEKRMIHFL